MTFKYKQLQIIKHALQKYIKRSGASESDLQSETLLLIKVTDEVKRIKELYKIG